MFPNNLLQFGFFPAWINQLDQLAEMAIPEPWTFSSGFVLQGRFQHMTILACYISSTYYGLNLERDCLGDDPRANELIRVEGEYAFFNTGLLTRHYQQIYAVFQKNKRVGALQPWYFKGWHDESASYMRKISELSLRPFATALPEISAFRPGWDVRMDMAHVLGEGDNLMRVPEPYRAANNLATHIEVAKASALKRAMICPSLVVPQYYGGKIQYLLPLSFDDPERADLVMALQSMDGYYLCSTCLTPEMAYCNARLLGRPTAPWLVALVQ